MKRYPLLLLLFMLAVYHGFAKASTDPVKALFNNTITWLDTEGNPINAHGPGFLYFKGKYYWFGEKRSTKLCEGVNAYSSKDLHNWKFEQFALPIVDDTTQMLSKGCKIERPKVVYNAKTHQFVMWFHFEKRNAGYNTAAVGVAVAEKPEGPYRYVKYFRPNGNMSRDMTLFADDDGSAYEIYSSRDNKDLRVCKLSDDYLDATADDHLLFSNLREGPAIFKQDHKYYLITSGCTGWKPNQASIHVANDIRGPWTLMGNPMQGPLADLTYNGQSSYILPVQGKKNQFIFIADRWIPADLKTSTYVWLPITLGGDAPLINWQDSWALSWFKTTEK